MTEVTEDHCPNWKEWADTGSKVGAYMHAVKLESSGDHASSFKYYLAAALKNYSPAQNNLGWLYRTGCGVERDISAAYAWFYHAAIQGNTLAIHNLGEMFLHGDGVCVDLELAQELFLYGASFNLVPSEAEEQEGINWAVQECRRELAWLQLREASNDNSNYGMAYLWLQVAIHEMKNAEVFDYQTRQSQLSDFEDLSAQLVSRVSAEQLAFSAHCIQNWNQESFSFRDRMGFPLTGSPFCKNEWLAHGESPPSEIVN
jgi:Sel1 repeat